MVRAIDTGKIIGDRQYIEYAGLSTDVKPVGGLMTGSTFIEVNTGYVYLYDEASETWNKVGD